MARKSAAEETRRRNVKQRFSLPPKLFIGWNKKRNFSPKVSIEQIAKNVGIFDFSWSQSYNHELHRQRCKTLKRN
jgi:hypothetical protein